MNNASISLLVCATVALKVLTAMAAEPYIVPTEVQEFAVEAGLSKALGIDWSTASDKNIAEYMNTLAAIDVVAQNIARANNRKDPSFDDYFAASTAWCKFPLRTSHRRWPGSATLWKGRSFRLLNRIQ